MGDEQKEQWKNLNNFKTVYQNNKSKPEEAFKWLWENFDDTKVSIYEFVFKYNDEVTSGMMGINSIKGTLQRWERAHKNACGVMSVIKGGEHPFMQAGSWLFLGTEVPTEIAVDGVDDFELYTPRKLDPNNEEDRKTWESYFRFDEKIYREGKDLEHYDGAKFL